MQIKSKDVSSYEEALMFYAMLPHEQRAAEQGAVARIAIGAVGTAAAKQRLVDWAKANRKVEGEVAPPKAKAPAAVNTAAMKVAPFDIPEYEIDEM